MSSFKKINNAVVMKKLLVLFCFTIFILPSNADEIMQNISGKISQYAAGLIPGEGITEVSIEIKDQEEPDFTILGVRDISKTENSNLFIQFSLHNDDMAGGDERYIGNLGLGYRKLTADKSWMLGVNSFWDQDIREGHSRASVGFEARASVLKFNLNRYYNLTGRQTVNGRDENAVGGIDYKLSSQIPYMPWARVGWKGYTVEADKASNETEGDEYSLEMALNPTLVLELSRDLSNHSDGDADSANLSFVYPPRDSKKTLSDGFISNEMWHKESMKNELSQKVERNNNLTVEIQGAVIFTKK